MDVKKVKKSIELRIKCTKHPQHGEAVELSVYDLNLSQKEPVKQIFYELDDKFNIGTVSGNIALLTRDLFGIFSLGATARGLRREANKDVDAYIKSNDDLPFTKIFGRLWWRKSI